MKLRCPAFSSASGTRLPAETAAPLSSSVPAVGRLSMRTAASVWPASASLKPKFAALRVSGMSSTVTSVASLPAGGVLGPTLTVSVALDDRPSASVSV